MADADATELQGNREAFVENTRNGSTGREQRRSNVHVPFDLSPHELLPEFPSGREQIVSPTQYTQVLLTDPSSLRGIG